MKSRYRSRSRRGVTTVEVALLLSIFLLFLFGIFEYCRFLMVLHVTNNAVRDGARYASVNVSRDSSFSTTDSTLTDSQGNTLISIRKFTTRKMAGMEGMITDYQVNIFACKTAELYANPPTFVTKGASIPWNQATFSERIAVQIKGTYKPIMPSFLFMPSSIPIDIAAAITSEG